MRMQEPHLFHHHKRRIWPYVLVGIVFLVLLALWFGYRAIQQFSPNNFFQNGFVQNKIVDYIGEEYRDVVEHIPLLLGYSAPKTYLILFQNNTEMRPGGGFIGSYATVRLDKGKMEILAFEGTESIDARAPKNWKIEPPKEMSEQLKVDRWYFRDSNWDPDFGISAKRALAFYAAEGGVAADDIDMVVAITPTVLESLMKRVGTVTVDGITFTPEDVTEKLEYEVEYGYEKRGISFAQRKQIMLPFFHTLMDKLTIDLFTHPDQYLALARMLIEEKHIVAYSTDPGVAPLIKQFSAEGIVAQTTGDYLLWVDANLAALKTDHAMDRHMSYTVQKNADGIWQGRVSMTYTHTGQFDWRTSRYRSFARVYVPQGSVLREVREKGPQGNRDVAIPLDQITQGQAYGKQWFGYFTVIEPGDTESVDVIYDLPETVVSLLNSTSYQLLVQKQVGLPSTTLTLDLDFDKKVQSAQPAEKQQAWGDDRYQVTMEMTKDIPVVIGF